MAASEKRLAWGLFFFLAAAAWRWSGLRYADGPFFSAGALIIGVMALAGKPRGWWARDPFFWSGLAFLLYLGIQTWNAGRPLQFDEGSGRWFHVNPPHPLWPSAFNRFEAAQMLYWFFPAWAVALAIRSPLLTRSGLGFLLRALVFNAGLLALFGIVQYLAGADKVFWRHALDCEFFASFTYTNHAAAYFLLMAGVAAGLLYRRLFRRDRPPRRTETAGLTAAALLCLAGATFSFSRAGIILSWALALLIAVYGLARGWRLWRPAARIQLAAVTAGLLVLFALAMTGAGGDAIRREFTLRRRPIHQAVPGLERINLDLSVRPRLWRIAWSVFREAPGYGTGGWGFRHRAAFHLPPERWGELMGNSGGANVHCDPLQFLVEFGLVGGGLMTLAWGLLAGRLFRRNLARGALFILSSAGLTLVAAFSLIDLPFRCPAILWTWTAVMAALPKCTAREPREVSAAAGKS